MKLISQFFARLGNAIKSLFTPEGQKKALAALGQAETLVQYVMPVVEMVAAATPNKTDDEIVAIVKRWSVPISIPTGPMTDQEKGSLLLQTAVVAATTTVAETTGIPNSVITLAVQTAYTILRAAAR
jgi:hypothetical protein